MESSEGIRVTVTLATSGRMESMDVSKSTTVKELMEYACGILGAPDNNRLYKDGTPLLNTSQTLEQAGVCAGDLLAVQPEPLVRPVPSRSTHTGTGIDSGALDFSSLFNQNDNAHPAASNGNGNGGLNFSSLLSGGGGGEQQPRPFFFAGMSLDEAMNHNPHPRAFTELLLSNDSLFKEFNYHQPLLADKMRGKSVDEATVMWRDELTKGSIRAAYAHTERVQKFDTMTQKLVSDPTDREATMFFQETENQKLIQAQYHNVMENYPESMGKILMLYIETHVNGHPVQSFVDSGTSNDSTP
jgi:hypothetical protein